LKGLRFEEFRVPPLKSLKGLRFEEFEEFEEFERP
jgi:hypothetical protein